MNAQAVPRRARLGEVLVDAGLLDEETLVARLAEHRRQGVPLGRVLMAHGDVSRRDLYQALSRTWGVPAVDLIGSPPDRQLLELVDPQLLLEHRFVPVSCVGGELVVAVCDEPTTLSGLDVADRLGAVEGFPPVRSVQLVATTDWDIEQAVLTNYGDTLVERAAFELAEASPELSAAEAVVPWQKVAGAVFASAVVAAAVVSWRFALSAALLVLNVMFAVGVTFKLVTCTLGMLRLRAARSGRPTGAVVPPGYDIADDELPTYTVLVPAYKEANVVEEVVANISELDYPLSKLQVLLLLEADDVATIEAAKAAAPPDFVRIVVVPPGGPQTKPKACNVGLAMAEGEFLVIYDAEDRPEPGQLREAVAAFRGAGPEVVCFQARLNYFNARQNILTRMFTLEYSSWFDYMLPGLDATGLPIPLGGTSNHFRTQALRDLGGWDPFNVTEDADLGVRAAALGHRVGIISSTTWEEACSEWKAWVRQRTRWIKGYMVTALVQLRNPADAWRRLGWRGMAGLVGLIAGTPALFLAAPLVWAFFAYTFLGGVVPQFHLPGWLQTVSLATLVVGNASMVALTALAARRRRNYHLMGYAALNPLYWMLHSLAAWRALFQLVRSPSVWEKTPHGIQHGPDGTAVDEHTPAPG